MSPTPGLPAHASRRNALKFGSAALAAGAAGAGFAWWRFQRAPAIVGNVDMGDLKALWQTSLPKPDGGTLTLQDYLTGGLVLNFWATWCPPCVREFPQLDQFAKAWAPRGWRVVGVAIDNLPEVKAFAKRVPVSFDLAVSGLAGLQWSRALGNVQGGLPFTAVYNPGGQLKTVLQGETTAQVLASLAAQPGSSLSK